MKTREQKKAEADRIIAALAVKGYEAMWAEGKGGGFWIKGQGYIELADALAILSPTATPFVVAVESVAFGFDFGGDIAGRFSTAGDAYRYAKDVAGRPWDDRRTRPAVRVGEQRPKSFRVLYLIDADVLAGAAG